MAAAASGSDVFFGQFQFAVKTDPDSHAIILVQTFGVRFAIFRKPSMVCVILEFASALMRNGARAGEALTLETTR